MGADGQKADRRAPPHVVTCGGDLAAGHVGGPCSHGRPEKKGRRVPHTLVRGETEMDLAGGQIDQAAADGHKKQGRRAPRVLARGWRLPLATEVDQSAASSKKKWAAAPHASSRGESQTAASQKEDQAAACGQ